MKIKFIIISFIFIFSCVHKQPLQKENLCIKYDFNHLEYYLHCGISSLLNFECENYGEYAEKKYAKCIENGK